MAHEFRLEDPGEGIHEAEILEIPVNKGDRVAEGDTVVVAETDKAAVEIPAPVDGEVQEIRVAVGDIAKVGDILIVFGENGTGPADHDAVDDDEEDVDKARDTDTRDRKKGEKAEQAEDPAEDDDQGDHHASEDGDDDGAPEADEASGKKPQAVRSGPEDDEKSPPQEAVLATPAVRGLARDKGVDLSEIDGSGDDGRVLRADVEAAAGDAGEAKGVKIVELRSLRRTTARRMAQAWREIPHVTHQDVIEITALERLRREHEVDIEEQGGALTLTPFIVKALAIALADFPNFNATFDADACAVHQISDCNIGVALDTDRGLLVPVLRDVGSRSIADLATDLNELGERLRGNSASTKDLRGATFTLTNVGAIGGTGLTPIINPPQTAIFGTARAELRQVVRGDIDDHATDVALCLPVCLTFDHRVADGAEAARFVERVKALLGDPGTLILNS